nr:hypothetical protein [Candidatus Thorarchaeota archaeon]NIW14460.1 hypothetical protein [Candidatus Thorarchaeota archaeon]NIW52527.1 hypothetical protein [Candidatus Korarchaeota archaeon]
ESHREIERKISCCLDTIQTIGASGIPIATVLNKIDLLSDHEVQHEADILSEITPNLVPVSALHRTNLDSLKRKITAHLKEYIRASFSLQTTSESLSFLSWLFSHVDVRDLKYEGESVNVVFESVPWFADKVRGRVEQLGGVFSA